MMSKKVFILFLTLISTSLPLPTSAPGRGSIQYQRVSKKSQGGGIVFKTQPVPEKKDSARIIIKKTDDGNVIQIGSSLQDDIELIRSFRNIFLTAGSVMLALGIFLGWFLTRRAMSGVDRVTKAALTIGKGNFTHRVPLGNEGMEIQSMARAFNDMADRIEDYLRDLKEITNNIAHDLRSPPTRIRGTIETTLSGTQNITEYRETAGLVIYECDLLIGMINTMPEIAEMDAGIIESLKSPVDVIKIVRDAHELFEPDAEEKNIMLDVIVPPDPLIVPGDVRRLQRVIANLLDNAIKYTPHEGKIITTVEKKDMYALISIADSGIGIEEENITRIFDKFYRGDRSRTTPGNGLGLCLVRAVVNAHGGSVNVKSSPGKGSIFTVRLPLSPPNRKPR
jgi:signal transduction histidine kinase